MGTLHLDVANQVYAFYLTEAFEKVTVPLLSIPNGPEPLQYLSKRAHQTPRKEELQRRFLTSPNSQTIYAEAEEGYAALSQLLGEDTYFFDER